MAGAHRGSWYRWNFISRIIGLLLVPTLFRWLNFGFVWHSVYWGSVTIVVLIWNGFILLTPLVGRIGCGWFCFIGTMNDLGGEHAFFPVKYTKPSRWLQALMITAFVVTSGTFYYLNLKHGIIPGWRFAPFWLDNTFSGHFKQVWIYDTMGALIFGLLLPKRWMCKNLCVVGGLCAVGAHYSRLVMTMDRSKCTGCRRCERECPVAIPILEVVDRNSGLIADADCVLCGRCKEVCGKSAIAWEFVWNRSQHRRAIPSASGQLVTIAPALRPYV